MGQVWRRLRDELRRQDERAFVWLVLAFAAGIALFFSWREDPGTWVSVGLCFGGAALFPMRRRAPALAFIALAVMAVGLGHGAAAWHTAQVATPLLARESRAFVLTGTVTAAERRPQGNRIVLGHFTLPDTANEQTPRHLRLTIPTAHGLPAVGERISVRAVVRPAALPVMPDGFQFQRFPYARGKA